MSFLIADSNVRIYEYNRLIRDLNGLSGSEFIEALNADFEIETIGQQLLRPQYKHEFGMYLEGEFYRLKLRENRRVFGSILESLDAQILYDRVLLPLLGITDLRNDDRIEYVPGNRPAADLKRCVDDQDFTLAFILFPTDINEVKSIADARLIMPPKSTYIEPKFRSGLVVYEV